MSSTANKSTALDQSKNIMRNPKMELNKPDLLKLLSYLEGELQARDVVIATLKSERVKHLLYQTRTRPDSNNDAIMALQRDALAASGPRVNEAQICSIADHQVSSLEHLVTQQRKAQIRIARVLKEAETRHRHVVNELIEEKKKREFDTAQGDDITYGLEKERSRLKQELVSEKIAKKKLEKDLKKATDQLEEEKNRTKQMVLFLLAERKKILSKYIEERKRSEDLAQILSEEKSRVDSMAEGLEEESKKSLQMEAELEKQLAHFDTETQQMKAALSKEEKRCREIEAELEKTKSEMANLQLLLLSSLEVNGMMQQPGTNGIKPPQGSPKAGVNMWVPEYGTPMSSVAKVVQPTATVSSVPVSAPTTGIARSVNSGQAVSLPNQTQQIYKNVTQPSIATAQASAVGQTLMGLRNTFTPTSQTAGFSNPMDKKGQQTPPPRAGVVNPPVPAAVNSKLYANLPLTPPSTKLPDAMNTIKKVPGVGRGIPPPVPPNKPQIPPKKDSLLNRRTDFPGAPVTPVPVPAEDKTIKPSPPTVPHTTPSVEKSDH
ncbi:hypothetical protein M8J75_001090 [Diaphorina citri]|nr:hypothetical protein M8J75_001090 [Diaphorina citri]KAI5731139.1 hypothetical protein M8J77_005281 [Diaphorina citri]